MNTVFTLALAASALAVTTAASAQVKRPNPDPSPRPIQVESQTVKARPTLTNPDATFTEPRPLFKIGNLPANVWAPVASPYDSHMNRTEAANPIWEEGSAF